MQPGSLATSRPANMAVCSMARSGVLRGLAWRQPWQAARPLASAARAAAVQQQGLTIEDGGAAAAAAAAQQQAAPTVAAPQPAAGPPGAAPAETPGPFPGDLDREKFQLHWSVDTWRDLRPRAWFDDLTSGQQPVPARVAAFLDTLRGALGTSGALGSTEAAAYYTYHLGRSGFFVAQAALGLLVARSAMGGSSEPQDGSAPSTMLGRLGEMLRTGWIGPFTEALLMYSQDYENIREGRYKLPWDMTTPAHRQLNPAYVLRKGAAFLQEATDVLRRRARGEPDQVWLDSPFFPGYYQVGFHYQSDGWLSQRSAQAYEASTETLFVGRQDAMQRCTLVPLSDFMAGKDPSKLRALEVACGTGRFATYVKDNYPGLDLTLLDLSPFYLAAARDNLRYWKQRRATGRALGGVDGNGATFIQGAAESLPAPDASYDLVYSVYLLHELPADVRRKAIFEMARVVKPGGMVIITDSAQLGDRKALDPTLGNFQDMNEPYYRDYLATDLGAIAQEAGLECGMKVVGSTTKTLSFTKPLPQPQPTPAAATDVTVDVGAAPQPDVLLN